MSARYLQSLRYNIMQCDWLNANIGTPMNADESEDESCQDAIDFLDNLKNQWEREIEDVSAQMYRLQEQDQSVKEQVS